MSRRRPRPDRPRTAPPAARAQRPDAPPVPLERGRARGATGALFVFAVAFAAAATEFIVTSRTGLLWWSGITVGLFAIGALGFFLSRGTVPRPEEPIYRPEGLRPWFSAAGLPTTPAVAVWYALVAVGVVGNFVLPLFFRR